MGIIYRGLNKNNGKSYIGQTDRTLAIRVGEHKRSVITGEGCPRLISSMLKHGVDAFEWEILMECDKAQLNDMEIFLIELYETCDSDHGYNLTTGGSSGSHSEETKEIMRHTTAARYDEKFPNHPIIDLPKYMIRFHRKVIAKGKTYFTDGYKISNHPNRKNKAFAVHIKTLDIKAQIEKHYKDALAYLNELNSEEYKKPPPKEITPKGIYPRKHGNHIGYEVRVKGKPSARFVDINPLYLPMNLQKAIEYLKTIS